MEVKKDGKGLLDPKHMVVGVFDPVKPGDYIGWRDTFENMVNEVHPGLMDILKVLRREKSKISEDVFNKAVDQVGTRPSWSYRRVAHELGIYLVSKLTGKAKTMAESATMSGGFEMYRLLTKR